MATKAQVSAVSSPFFGVTKLLYSRRCGAPGRRGRSSTAGRSGPDRRHARQPPAVAVQPRREPAADVASARDGREVVEFLQQLVARESLQEAERERPAADAAAGERERGVPARVEPRVYRREAHVRDLLQLFGESLFEQEAVGVGQRLARHAVAPRAQVKQGARRVVQHHVLERLRVVDVLPQQLVQRPFDDRGVAAPPLGVCGVARGFVAADEVFGVEQPPEVRGQLGARTPALAQHLPEEPVRLPDVAAVKPPIELRRHDVLAERHLHRLRLKLAVQAEVLFFENLIKMKGRRCRVRHDSTPECSPGSELVERRDGPRGRGLLHETPTAVERTAGGRRCATPSWLRENPRTPPGDNQLSRTGSPEPPGARRKILRRHLHMTINKDSFRTHRHVTTSSAIYCEAARGRLLRQPPTRLRSPRPPPDGAVDSPSPRDHRTARKTLCRVLRAVVDEAASRVAPRSCARAAASA